MIEGGRHHSNSTTRFWFLSDDGGWGVPARQSREVFIFIFLIGSLSEEENRRTNINHENQ